MGPEPKEEEKEEEKEADASSLEEFGEALDDAMLGPARASKDED